MKKLFTSALLAGLSIVAFAQSALTITGIVTDSAGAPAAGRAIVAIDSTGQIPVFGFDMTDPNGMYSIQNMGNASGVMMVGTDDCDGTILVQAFPYSGSDSLSANFTLSCVPTGNPWGGGNGPGNGGGNHPGGGNGPWGGGNGPGNGGGNHPGGGNGPWGGGNGNGGGNHPGGGNGGNHPGGGCGNGGGNHPGVGNGGGNHPGGGICNPCNPVFFPHTDSTLTVDFHLVNVDSTLTYTWDFGDGSTATGINPQYTYTTAGSYVACVAVSGMLPDSTVCNDTVCRVVVVPFTPQLGGCNGGGNHPWGGGNHPSGGNGPGNGGGNHPGGGNGPWGGGNGPQPCMAGFVAVPDTAPMSYFFMTLPGDTNNVYAWDFGDGATGSTPLENHMYANTGSYVVCLTVTNAVDSCTNTHCNTLVVSSATWTNINSFTVGTSENTWSTELNAYPVPFQNTLQLEFEVAEEGTLHISLMDAQGRVVLNESADATRGIQRVSLNTESVSNGIYFVMVEANGTTTVRRVVK